MVAIINRKFEVMHMLLEGGANINAVAKVRNILSYLTLYTVQHIKTWICTLPYIFSLNSSSFWFFFLEHHTTLHYTTHNIMSSQYTLLYTTLHTQNGYTALLFAAISCTAREVKMLLDKGADPRAAYDVSTGTYIYCDYDNLFVLQYLL